MFSDMAVYWFDSSCLLQAVSNIKQ